MKKITNKNYVDLVNVNKEVCFTSLDNLQQFRRDFSYKDNSLDFLEKFVGLGYKAFLEICSLLKGHDRTSLISLIGELGYDNSISSVEEIAVINYPYDEYGCKIYKIASRRRYRNNHDGYFDKIYLKSIDLHYKRGSIFSHNLCVVEKREYGI